MPTKESEIGALWERTSQKDGSIYYTGKIGDQEVVVFTNKYHQPGDKQPALRVYKSEPRQ